MFFKSGKYNSCPYQIKENSKQDDTFNKRKRTIRHNKKLQSKEQKTKVKKQRKLTGDLHARWRQINYSRLCLQLKGTKNPSCCINKALIIPEIICSLSLYRHVYLQSRRKMLTHLSKTNAFYRRPSVILKKRLFCRQLSPLSPFQC